MSPELLDMPGSTTSSAQYLRSDHIGITSPVTPRRPTTYTDGDQTELSLASASQDKNNSLKPPSNMPYSQSNDKFLIPEPRRLESQPSDGPWSPSISSPIDGAHFIPRSSTNPKAHLDHEKPTEKNKLGTFSAINIILGKTIGVGIYSVPSSIYAGVGSVGMTLLVWIIGAAISFCGLAVYLDLGTALPCSGGDNVYLERIFQRPKMLATCVFMVYVVLLGFSTPNCIVLGEYAMYALEAPANRWNVRSIAVLTITSACVIHVRYPRLGLRIINILGVGKMIVVTVNILSGLASIPIGISRAEMPPYLPSKQLTTTVSSNFHNLFESSSVQPYDYATALLKVLYCFRGYNTANQVLSEIRNPVPTLKTAAPLALSIVSASYILVNIAYFCAVEKNDFRTSGPVVAGHFSKNIFGEVVGERVLPCFVIMSAYGSVAATSFAQARVNQELARDGLLPFSSFWAASTPWGTPAPALLLHWTVSVLVIVAPVPGEMYSFLVEIGGYPASVIAVAVAAGSLYLQMKPSERWHSPCPARKVYTALFLLSNLVLLVLPWVKPKPQNRDADRNMDGRIAYYAYPATGLGVLGLGVVYWVWWSRIPGWWAVMEERLIRTSLNGEDTTMRDWRSSVKVGFV